MFIKTRLASLVGLAVLSQTVSATATHDVHFRYNLAGYSLERPKNIVIMTNKNFHAGSGNPTWILKKAGIQVAKGKITPGMKVAKQSKHHSPMKHSYHLDLRTQANTAGNYELTIQGESHADEKAAFEVKADPYGDIAAEMLVHISSRRSGVQSPIKQYRDAMRSALTYSATDGPQLGVLSATEALTEAQKDLALKPHYFDGTSALPVYKLRDVETNHPNYIAEKSEKNKVGNALWAEDPTIDSFDVSGGWYDAGDYIKFTLTIAHATYYMLRAYETNGELFDKHTIAANQYYGGYNGIITSGTGETGRDAPLILDEAKFGLDYLAKMYDASRADEFVVQVGDQRDHLNEDLNNDGKRLPIYDGTRHVLADAVAAQGITDKRPILSALSPGHMGLTLAALSLGAKVFEDAGYTEDANRYKAKAKELYNRMFAASTKNGKTKAGILIANAHSYETTTGTDATSNGVAQGASCVDFSYATLEKSNITNNFYNDSAYCSPDLPGLYRRKDSASQKNTYDNLGLGAVEYYRINTNKKNVLANANSLATKAGIAGWASWSNVNLSLHYRLAQLKQTNNQFTSEINSFRSYSNRTGGGLDAANNLFGLPQQIVWSSLGNHLIAAPYAALGALLDNNGDTVTSQVDAKSNMLYNILDYTLGRNNWGVSMVYSESVQADRRLEKYYNWIYTKLDLPTIGAVSQGPASKSDYESQATNGMTPVSQEEKNKRDKFNTSGAVFYEYSKNWVNMEAMGYQQAAALYTWAVATKLEGATGTGGSSNNKPTINWNGSQPSTVVGFEPITFVAQAADSDGQLQSLTFSIQQGGVEVASYSVIDTSAAQFSYTWTPDEFGSYIIIASVEDNESAVSQVSHTFTVTDVVVDVQLSLSSSATVVDTDEQFTVTVNVAGQSAALVDSVELFVDNLATGPADTLSPFDFTHSIAAAGSYSVHVKGFDDEGTVLAQSSGSTITVNAIGGGGGGEPSCASLGLTLNPSNAGGLVTNTYNLKGVWHRKSWPGASNYNHSSAGDYMLDGGLVYKVLNASWVTLNPTNPQYSEYWNQWEKVCQQ